MSHTPGPWKVWRKRVTVCVLTADGTYITENVRAVPNQQANARLIATAPDLLEWIKTLENDDGKIPDWLWAQRNELIARAEGTL